MTKIDFKKELKHLYNPSVKKVEIVEVPMMKLLLKQPSRRSTYFTARLRTRKK